MNEMGIGKMTSNRFGALSLAAFLLLGSMAAHATDIDVFAGLSSGAGAPNGLIVLDNGADFSAAAGNCTYIDTDPARAAKNNTAPSLNGTAAGIEQCAIYNAIDGLQAGTINLGFMVYGVSGNSFGPWGCTASANGGCLIKPLTLMDAAGKTAFKDFIYQWTTSGSTQYNIKANGEST